VSLLYVFFCTFGALTHHHPTSASAGGPSNFQDSRQTVCTLDASGPAPTHCPICEWQSLQITPPPASAPIIQPALLRIEQTAAVFRLHSLSAFRSSSRGPPRV
jgi:hypothetical protein